MGDFCNCTSLTNTPVVCYLYSIDRIPADGTLWSTTVQGCGDVNADRLGSLAQLLRKAALFV